MITTTFAKKKEDSEFGFLYNFFPNDMYEKPQQNKHNQFVKIQNRFFEKTSGGKLICIERSVGP